jgi:hypothetical protein
MIQDDDTQIANMKFLLMCFDDLSGLKINYLKYEVIVMGSSRDRQQRVADWLNCKRGSFPAHLPRPSHLRHEVNDGSVTVFGP